MLFNPGGPGISGISDVADRYSRFSEVLQQRFDIVAFDPRGVGRSTPVHCRSDRQKDELATDPATARKIAVGRALAAGCDRGAQAALLPFLGTRDTARDLDRIRAALGDQKLTCLGHSSGTYLGSVYAQDVPGRVRALALDGAIDPAVAPLDRETARGTGLQRAFADFTAACTPARGCAWQPGGDLLTAYRRLLAALRTRPLPVAAGAR